MQHVKGSGFLLLLAILFFALVGCEKSVPPEDDEPLVIEIDGSAQDDDEIVTYPGAYSADELREILSNFRWQDTTAVRERDPDGTPKLYYVEMLVPTIEETDELTELMVPWDYLPLFEEEFVTGDEDVEIIDIDAIAEGRMIFAILPGEVYNLVRETALAGEPSYPFVRLREIPSLYRLPDGTLDPDVFIEYLASLDEAGAWDIDSVDELERANELGHSAGLMKFIRNIGRAFRRTIDFFREKVVAAVHKKRDLELELVLTERDPGFRNKEVDEKTETQVIRAWGVDAGRKIYPTGALVGVHTGIGIARTAGRLKDDGTARLRIPNDRVRKFTIDLENHSASITTMGMGLRRVRYLVNADKGNKNRVDLRVKDPHIGVYGLTVFSDAYQFSKEMFGFSPHRAIVAQFKNRDNAYVPASRYVEMGRYIDRGIGFQMISDFIMLPIDRIYDIDIVISGVPRFEREVLYHEYGHWVLAGILHSAHPTNTAFFWGDSIESAIMPNAAGSDSHVMRMVNEGFADFFAIATTGSASYAENLVSKRCNYISDAKRCFEENLGSLQTPYYEEWTTAIKNAHERDFESMYQLVGWDEVGVDKNSGLVERGASVIATFLVDLNDGGREPLQSAGVLWESEVYGRDQPTTLRPYSWKTHFHDERVSMSGLEIASALRSWIRSTNFSREYYEFDDLLHEEFAAALARVALTRFTPLEVCEVFALHSPHRSCPQLGAEVAAQWDAVPDVENFRVISTDTFNGTSPFLLMVWDALPSKNDELEVSIRDTQGATVLRTVVGGTTRLYGVAEGLLFDESYQVSAVIRRHDRVSTGVAVDVTTVAERPHSLRQSKLNSTTIRVSWTSTASQYELRLRYPEGGTNTVYYTHDNYADLTRSDFPFLFRMEHKMAAGTYSFNGYERSPHALVRVVAMNQEGARTSASKQELDLILTEYPLPNRGLASVIASQDGDDSVELGERPSPDVALHTSSPLMSGMSLCTGCESESEDYQFEVVSEGVVFSCHHSEPALRLEDEQSDTLWGYFVCTDEGASETRIGEFSLDDGGEKNLRWLHVAALNALP